MFIWIILFKKVISLQQNCSAILFQLLQSVSCLTFGKHKRVITLVYFCLDKYRLYVYILQERVGDLATGDNRLVTCSISLGITRSSSSRDICETRSDLVLYR